MLKILRHKKTAKKVWIFLALIIIPAFALWGFGGAFRSREESAPRGKIFGRNISSLEIKDSLSAVTTAAIIQFGDNFPEAQKNLNFQAPAWQRLILLEEAKRRKIKATDQEVVAAIENMPYFRYKGAFDNKTYEQTLQYVFHLKPRTFEEQTRQNLMLNKLYRQVIDGVKIDAKEIEEAYKKVNKLENLSGAQAQNYQKEKALFAKNLLEQRKEEKFTKFIEALNKKAEQYK